MYITCQKDVNYCFMARRGVALSKHLAWCYEHLNSQLGSQFTTSERGGPSYSGETSCTSSLTSPRIYPYLCLSMGSDAAAVAATAHSAIGILLVWTVMRRRLSEATNTNTAYGGVAGGGRGAGGHGDEEAEVIVRA